MAKDSRFTKYLMHKANTQVSCDSSQHVEYVTHCELESSGASIRQQQQQQQEQQQQQQQQQIKPEKNDDSTRIEPELDEQSITIKIEEEDEVGSQSANMESPHFPSLRYSKYLHGSASGYVPVMGKDDKGISNDTGSGDVDQVKVARNQMVAIDTEQKDDLLDLNTLIKIEDRIDNEDQEDDRTSTTSKPPYDLTCAECGKTFAAKQSLKLHQQLHTGLKPHQCDQCGRCFTYKHDRDQHLVSHSDERPHTCTVCQKKFKHKMALGKHMVIHSETRERYRCKHCGMTLATKGALTQHTYIHTDPDRYKCKDCGKTFARSDRLKCHMRVHTDERPYSCLDCGVKFRFLGSMKDHVARYHFHLFDGSQIAQLAKKQKNT